MNITTEEYETLKKIMKKIEDGLDTPNTSSTTSSNSISTPLNLPVKIKKERKLTPYNIFMQENLKKIKEENPKLPHSEIFKLVIAKWKQTNK